MYVCIYIYIYIYIHAHINNDNDMNDIKSAASDGKVLGNIYIYI